MTDLIKRLSAGELVTDGEVLAALGWKRRAGGLWTAPDGELFSALDFKPTTDMNAALRLMPEGWRTWEVFHKRDGTWSWGLYRLDDDCGPIMRSEGAPTAAIALTVAILVAHGGHHD